MIDDQHPRAINRRARGPAPPRENDGGNDRHRVQIAAVEKLHLAVDNQTLCGLVTVDELDVYPDEAALRAWNDGPLEQCAQELYSTAGYSALRWRWFVCPCCGTSTRWWRARDCASAPSVTTRRR